MKKPVHIKYIPILDKDGNDIYALPKIVYKDPPVKEFNMIDLKPSKAEQEHLDNLEHAEGYRHRLISDMGVRLKDVTRNACT